MYMTAKVIETAGSHHINVVTRGDVHYQVKVPESLATHKYPKKDDLIVIKIRISNKFADYICPLESAIYLVIINHRDEFYERRILKFIDQDILFSYLVRTLDLVQVPFIWNTRTIAFRDEVKTSIEIIVHEIETPK